MGEPGPGGQGPAPHPEGQEEVSEAELQAKMEELRQQLADAPAELVVANHCFGLFELAALHLSLQPPRLPQARLAIDALAALLEGLAGRLGSEERQLQEGLASLRLAYVQIHGAQEGEPAAGPGPEASPEPEPGEPAAGPGPEPGPSASAGPGPEPGPGTGPLPD